MPVHPTGGEAADLATRQEPTSLRFAYSRWSCRPRRYRSAAAGFPCSQGPAEKGSCIPLRFPTPFCAEPRQAITHGRARPETSVTAGTGHVGTLSNGEGGAMPGKGCSVVTESNQLARRLGDVAARRRHYPVPVRRGRSFAPRFIHAVLAVRRSALRFARCDQLARELSPPG